MDPEKERPLLLTVVQVERLIGYRRSKIYTLMQERDHPFPAQAWPRPVAARRRRALGRRPGPRGRGVTTAEPSPM